jgi:hypothetical protein
MMNKAASERRAEKNFLDDFAEQRKREEEECFYTAGVVPPKLAPNCKINLF